MPTAAQHCSWAACTAALWPVSLTAPGAAALLQTIRGLFGAGDSQDEAVEKLEKLQDSIRLVKALFRDQQATEVGATPRRARMLPLFRRC